MLRTGLAILFLSGLCVLVGCKQAYYSTWEKLGWEKRDLLKDDVTDARNSQQKASESFKTTLERFKELNNFSGGDLEKKYNELKSQYESCESRAADVNKRIASVESVGKDLFAEWKTEIGEYQSAQLKASSQQKYNDTRVRYDQLVRAMKTASAKMPPVLAQFKDQVLYLKHNLNAQAVASLQGTTTEIQLNVDSLIKEMDAAIAEANTFIGTLK